MTRCKFKVLWLFLADAIQTANVLTALNDRDMPAFAGCLAKWRRMKIDVPT